MSEQQLYNHLRLVSANDEQNTEELSGVIEQGPWVEIEGKGAWQFELVTSNVTPTEPVLAVRDQQIDLEEAQATDAYQLNVNFRPNNKINEQKSVWLCRLGSDGAQVYVIAELQPVADDNKQSENLYKANAWHFPDSSFDFPFMTPTEELPANLNVQIENVPRFGPFTVNSI